jgi:transposase
MKRPHASNDVRERALAAVDGGRSVADVAAFFQNDPSTIDRWVRQRARTGSGLARPRSGRPSALTQERTIWLAAQVAQHPDATLAELCHGWASAFGARPSLSAMSRWLRESDLTRKKRR